MDTGKALLAMLVIMALIIVPICLVGILCTHKRDVIKDAEMRAWQREMSQRALLIACAIAIFTSIACIIQYGPACVIILLISLAGMGLTIFWWVNSNSLLNKKESAMLDAFINYLKENYAETYEANKDKYGKNHGFIMWSDNTFSFETNEDKWHDLLYNTKTNKVTEITEESLHEIFIDFIKEKHKDNFIEGSEYIFNAGQKECTFRTTTGYGYYRLIYNTKHNKIKEKLNWL